MSAPNEEKKEEKKLTTEELLAKLAADSYESRRAINAMAEAMVKLKQDVDSLKAGGGGGAAGAPQPDAVAGLLRAFGLEKKETDLEGVVKAAEGLAKLGDSLDRFRKPSPIGIGEALLMRLGMRAAFPRYMTKAELTRYERAMGILSEEFEEEERGESEH